MGISEEPGALLVSILAIAMSAFLLVLQRGRLSERQQTGVWIGVTILFFAACSLYFNGTANAGVGPGRRLDPRTASEAHEAGLGR